MIASFGRFAPHDLDVFVGSIDEDSGFGTSSRYFITCLAFDASAWSAEAIRALAREVLDNGAAFILAWGEQCERVHDLVDEEIRTTWTESEPLVITTWHDRQPLSEALWTALWASLPDDAFYDECRSVLVLCDTTSLAEVTELMAHPERLDDAL